MKKTRIIDAFPKVGHAMTFLFDYGDEWLFRVEVVGLGQKVAKVRYPRVLKEGRGARAISDPDEDEAAGDQEGRERNQDRGLAALQIQS